MGLSDVDSIWQPGITDLTLINGNIQNYDFFAGSGLPRFYKGDISFKYTSDSSNIRNYIRIVAFILKNGDIASRKLIKSTGDLTYIIGKANDILYVARYILTKIVSVSSSTTFDIPAPESQMIGRYDASFIANALGGRLVCSITKANGDTQISPFDISGTTIVLDTAFTGIASGDIFELINAYDILPEGQTSYPATNKGFIIKHVKPDEDATILFTSRDAPDKQIGQVVCYYNAIEDYTPEFIFEDSILKYNLYFYTETIDYPLTKEQIDSIITEYHKFIVPLKTITLVTYRPSIPKEGWVIPVNVTNITDGIELFTISGVSYKWVHPFGDIANEPLLEITVTLSSYINNLADILARFKRKSDVDKAKLAQNLTVITTIPLTLSATYVEGYISTLSRPVLSAATDVTETEFTINWGTVTGATDYYVIVSKNADLSSPLSDYNNIRMGGVFSTSAIISGTEVTPPGTKFYYAIQAKNSSETSEYSLIANVTTNVTFSYALHLPLTEGTGTPSDTSGNSNTVSLINSSGLPTWITDGFGTGLSMASGTLQAIEVDDSSSYEFSDHNTGLITFRKNNTGYIRLFNKDSSYEIGAEILDTSLTTDYEIAPNFPSGSPSLLGLQSLGITWITGHVYKLAWCLDLVANTYIILRKDVDTGIVENLSYTFFANINYYSDLTSPPAINNSASTMYIGNHASDPKPVGVIYEFALFTTALDEATLRSLL